MKKIVIIVITFMVIMGLSIGYSALNTNLMISGEAVIRVPVDIRVDKITLKELVGATELYNPKYTKDTTSIFLNLKENTIATYIIEIRNYSLDNYELENILFDDLPNTVTYEIKNTFIGDMISKNSMSKIEITFTASKETNLNLNMTYQFKKVEKYIFAFDYTEQIEKFTVPVGGNYKIECWGASGGNVNYPDQEKYFHGGYGAYATGVVRLKKEDILYIGVGGEGETTLISETGYRPKGGYNGGGYGYIRSTTKNMFPNGGGGATHVATKDGLLKDLSDSRDSIIIVAGGGAGAYGYISNDPNSWWHGNSAGGYIGGYSYEKTMAGTQTTGYSFGEGGNTLTKYTTNANYSGGGGGYYGGQPRWGEVGAGGGSSYIGSSSLISYQDTKKAMYCYNCDESEEENTYTVSTTNISEEAISLYAKIGNGYVKITLLS